VSVVRFRPRAPLPKVNLLNNFTFSCGYKKVWEFLKDFRVKHTYVRDGVYYYERRVRISGPGKLPLNPSISVLKSYPGTKLVTMGSATKLCS
jgi:hypothetical protein